MRYPKKKKSPESTRIREIFGAGYGSRTRLHGLGNIKVGSTMRLRNNEKCSICNGFSVFARSRTSRIFEDF